MVFNANKTYLGFIMNTLSKHDDAIVKQSKGLFTPKTRVFFCCGNSAADISKSHTFRLDPLADEVLQAA